MANFNDIINRTKKSWSCPDLMDGFKKQVGQKLPFSSPLLNYSTYGGIPRNAITEFCGNPGGGKSTTAVDIAKNSIEIFQQEYDEKINKLMKQIEKGNKEAKAQLADLQELGPKKVLYLDLEHTFDAKWSATLGIDNETIQLMQPPNVPAEDILETVQDLIQTGELGLVVLDSIPSLVTKQELEKKYGERTVAQLAGLLTVFCRKIIPILTRHECTLLLINQIRDNMDNPYVVQTPGGKALKFYCSLRMLFKIGTPIDFLGNELPASAENPSGCIVTAKILKQKSAPWDRRNGSYYLMYQSGIRIDIDYAQLAVKKHGFIRKGGSWFTICDPVTQEPCEDEEGNIIKLQGMAKVYEYLQTNKEYFDTIKKFINANISGDELEPEGEENAYE